MHELLRDEALRLGAELCRERGQAALVQILAKNRIESMRRVRRLEYETPCLVQRIGPLKDQLKAEARGNAGDLPLLLRGLLEEVEPTMREMRSLVYFLRLPQ